MSHARPARRRLAAAVVTVLAVTVGGSALTAPAIAAPATDSAAASDVTTTQDVITIPPGTTIFGGTATGYLTSSKESSSRSWIRASDGTSGGSWMWYVGVEATGLGDLVAVNTNDRSFPEAILTNMATRQKLFTVPLLGQEYVGAADRTLFTTVDNASGGKDLRMHVQGTSDMPTTGLPANATSIDVSPGTPGHGLVTYSTGTGEAVKRYVGLIDLATGAVAEQRERASDGNVAVSATHLTWVEYDASSNATVVVVDRSTGMRTNMPIGTAWREDIEVGLVGDWVTYGTLKGLSEVEPHPLYALTARSLKDGTTTRKLLDHTLAAVAAPDGTLVVRGGTVEHGEGFYRIALGADGVPTAKLVATTGEPTKLTLLSQNVPAVIDLDQNGGRVPLEWKVSRYNVEARITLRHVRTGKSMSASFIQAQDGVVRWDWRGELMYESAYNGDYTWEFSGRPLNGIGPTVTSSGTFKVVRKAAPHDYNDNGSPDVLLRDGSGRLWRADSHYDTYNQQLNSGEQKLISSGWGGYNQIEAVGNIAGAAHGDIVARDTAGVLWHYLGKGDGTFAPRYKVGTGWGGYKQITGGSDLNGDGKSDLVATDGTGALWLHKGTGSWSAPFAPRVKLGTGWHGYNQITATGNIAGAAAGDLVARDTAGVLWLHLGKGDGTFAPRVKIGTGWQGYSHLVGIGDADRDGRPDLFATNSADNRTYLYKGTGSWSAPFGQRQDTGMPNNRPTSVV
ncbi:FG-GAP repeat domain-containing protein [Streptomyces sp. NPDC003035]|uniref:FG-GAP repeat domain-containing protein n=1 Tax=Streptomyces sp. NPDC003035 TaxID=3364676 RepID=UPI00368E899E